MTLERQTVPHHNHWQSDANDTHPSVVLVMLRLHIARPFQMVESAYMRVDVTRGVVTATQGGGMLPGLRG